jgi:hypothetical protein
LSAVSSLPFFSFFPVCGCNLYREARYYYPECQE